MKNESQTTGLEEVHTDDRSRIESEAQMISNLANWDISQATSFLIDIYTLGRNRGWEL
jgi:hypothetical protein